MIYTREKFVEDIVTTTYRDMPSMSIVGDISAPTVYLRFVSDDTVHHTGFNVTFIAASRRGR